MPCAVGHGNRKAFLLYLLYLLCTCAYGAAGLNVYLDEGFAFEGKLHIFAFKLNPNIWWLTVATFVMAGVCEAAAARPVQSRYIACCLLPGVCVVRCVGAICTARATASSHGVGTSKWTHIFTKCYPGGVYG